MNPLYKHSLTLLTDLYQLTMAYGYWKTGKADQESVFHLFFRKSPFAGGYSVAAGLENVIQWIQQFKFDQDDIEFLRTVVGNDANPIFDDDFLDYLAHLELKLSIAAVPEGTIVFPHEPLVRVRGPILQAQLLETALLNIINFQTLIATKSARICRAAGNQPVLEFGLRRAQGIDGSISASRAAFIGGAAATSNVLAGKLLGIPVRGTHAHSWVMAFEDEQQSFVQYADAMPNNCIFLVDTFNTLAGVDKAIDIGKSLRKRGHNLGGIRLDSGDLAWLSIEARKRLDQAGFEATPIVASNDLDEHLIASLKGQGAQISVWGVGTKLTTAFDQPALGGVYKLALLQNAAGLWEPKIKLSEQRIKVSTPGMLQVRRFFDDTQTARADMIFNELDALPDPLTIIDPLDHSRNHLHHSSDHFEDLLVPIVVDGKQVYKTPNLNAIQARTREQLKHFHDSILRLDNPHNYPVGLEATLHQTKSNMVVRLRDNVNTINELQP